MKIQCNISICFFKENNNKNISEYLALINKLSINIYVFLNHINI
jgi:hypothetical protein